MLANFDYTPVYLSNSENGRQAINFTTDQEFGVSFGPQYEYDLVICQGGPLGRSIIQIKGSGNLNSITIAAQGLFPRISTLKGYFLPGHDATRTIANIQRCMDNMVIPQVPILDEEFDQSEDQKKPSITTSSDMAK